MVLIWFWFWNRNRNLSRIGTGTALNHFNSTTLFNSDAYCGRTAQCQQQRGMANLKLIGLRLKSVKNIQKITQAVKMVSSYEADSNLYFFYAAVSSKRAQNAK
jgi:hypothetical protein